MASFFRDRLQQWWHSLDEGQHIALSFFAPCALLAMVLSVASLHASITMPFRAPKALLTASQQLITNERAIAAEQARKDALKDTDGDGISDADEATIFRTSPYLSDTDSDGVDDAAEVRAGTDPNCPPERDCYGYIEMNADGIPQASSGSEAQGQTPTTAIIETPTPPESTTATEIRAYLVRNQLATSEQVAALPDEAVIELYRRAYADLEGASPAASATPSASESSPVNP